MAGETQITLVGNLTGDPDLRFTPSGAAVANFTVASTPRTFDRQTGEWRDGEAMFINCAVWRQYAEHVAESLTKGMRVIVQGRLKSRSYETQQGDRRTVFEIDVDEVGPSLRYATAQVTRTSGGGQGGGNWQGNQNQGGGQNYGNQGGYGNQGQQGQGGYGNQSQQGQGGQGGDPWGSSGGGYGGGNRGGNDPWNQAAAEGPPF